MLVPEAGWDSWGGSGGMGQLGCALWQLAVPASWPANVRLPEESFLLGGASTFVPGL